MCPHCYRRESRDAYLVSNRNPIEPHQDRRWYFHAQKLTGIPKDPTCTQLVDPRFLRPEELRKLGIHIDNASSGFKNRYCIHCHNRIPMHMWGARLCSVLSPSNGLIAEFLSAMKRNASNNHTDLDHTDSGNWVAHKLPLVHNYFTRRTQGMHWLCLPTLNTAGRDPGYIDLLHTRRVLEADELLLLLPLDNAGDHDARLFLEDLVSLYGSQTATQKIPVCIILFLPENENVLDTRKHRMLLEDIAYAFESHVQSVVSAEQSLEDVLFHALTDLAVLDGLTAPQAATGQTPPSNSTCPDADPGATPPKNPDSTTPQVQDRR